MDIANYLESYMVAVFPFWSTGMVMAVHGLPQMAAMENKKNKYRFICNLINKTIKPLLWINIILPAPVNR